jgi:hypothetical protein
MVFAKRYKEPYKLACLNILESNQYLLTGTTFKFIILVERFFMGRQEGMGSASQVGLKKAIIERPRGDEPRTLNWSLSQRRGV